jgi:hypothetical protein
MAEIIYPPAPPTQSETANTAEADESEVVSSVENIKSSDDLFREHFVRGSFDYLPRHDKTYIKDAYDVITRNEWWKIFKLHLETKGVNRQTGFMFTNDDFYHKIKNAIASTPIGGGHSGCSIGCVMRDMEYIALHGEYEYYKTKIRYAAQQRNNLEYQRRLQEMQQIRQDIENETTTENMSTSETTSE